MKNITTLLLSIVMLLTFSAKVMAQEKAKVKVAHMKQKGGEVLFTVNAARPFIFGGNKYYLHIGNKAFTRNVQSKPNGKGQMTFFIPQDDYKGLQDGAGVYLTYGELVRDGSVSLEELSKEYRTKCWSLGKFDKSSLAK